MSTDDRQEKLEQFLKEVANLTVNHKVVADEAVVYPSALGEAVSRVDPDWHHKSFRPRKATKLGRRLLMASESRRFVAGFRKYYEVEIETMIRQMKIQGGTLDDCIAELRILAGFVQSQADALTDAWPDLLKDTIPRGRTAPLPQSSTRHAFCRSTTNAVKPRRSECKGHPICRQSGSGQGFRISRRR